MVMGEDVGRAGGVFRATAGLRERFGADRCVDTPLAEAGILGTAVGLCMAGWRPVCEMQYDAFSYPCLDQLITHVGRYRWRTGGGDGVPARRAHAVRRRRARARAARRLARGVLRAHARRSRSRSRRRPPTRRGCSPPRSAIPIPVVILEPKLHLPHRARRGARGRATSSRSGKARLAREGDDMTLVAYGAMVPLCERAADALAGEASVEVLDIRSLKPLDEDALLASAAKTGRVVIVQEAPRTAGFGAELAAILAEKAILDLRGPVLRVTGYDVPYPYWKIEDAYMPSVERVVDACRKLLAVLSELSPSACACGSSAASRATGSATPPPGKRSAGTTGRSAS